MNRSPERLVVFLKETLLIKNLSPERAAPYIGCSGRQIRRWIEGKVNPSPVYCKAIEIGIEKINFEIPGDTPDGLVSWCAIELSKEEKIYRKQFGDFFNTLCKKVRPIEREHILFNRNYLIGFQEILFLARKHNIKLPNLKK